MITPYLPDEFSVRWTTNNGDIEKLEIVVAGNVVGTISSAPGHYVEAVFEHDRNWRYQFLGGRIIATEGRR